jgi:mitochondrial fission protein ELM1
VTPTLPAEAAPAWIVTDGAAGNEKQAEALAAALGSAARTIRLAPRPPWRWFAPRWVPGSVAALGVALEPPWPALAIGCGRQGALALRVLRRLSGGATRTVQILDPRIDPRAFDLVIVPAHDALRGDNVLVARGALHAVDDAWLARARDAWPQFATLPAPRTAVLLGGSHRRFELDEAYWRGLAGKLGTWLHRDGGSLLLTSSRRSPEWLRAAARAEFGVAPGVQWHGPDDGANPYAALLAWADRIVVTPDSINLLSEACATRVPVLAHVDRPLTGGHGDFFRALVAAGRVQAMTDAYAPWPVAPLNDMAALAAGVARRLASAH